ncbi:unnamed protein product [Euphydryas editha]|uniref:C2H2-type domain-containing protein n=1 Tax=Euphydryas editha TaxID=104508 RepID=A0AAU9UX41_EUPED|nr:unnamed protein product [Euphydryas editha]
MGSEINCDKLSIKNILFTKALPNYTIPVATNGYKVFPCSDCGDRFLFESSYNDHINRKSLKITYFCRHCNKIIINNNRCRLLSHIRSHAFKTTTINVSDLKIEPLPIQDMSWTLSLPNNPPVEILTRDKDDIVCYECKISLDRSDKIYKDRAKHYMKYTNIVYSCPVCLFSLPNICALKAHLRIHLKIPPFFCPECGIHLSTRSISYPYNHDCEGFNMIRATTRLKCKQKKCYKIFHPNDYRMHIKNHLEKVYKCINCLKVWNNRPTKKHFPCNNNDKLVKCFRCQICANTILLKNAVNKHSNFHFKSLQIQIDDHIYPCLSCSLICNEISTLINHHISKHASNDTKNLLINILKEYNSITKPVKQGFYRVLKKCDKCLRSFLYRCEYENIQILPNECPYECSIDNPNNYTQCNENQIICNLCKNKVNENWDKIKNHFATFHKNHKCLDLKVILTKIDNKISTSGVYKKADHLKCVMSKNTNLNNKILLSKKKIYKKNSQIPSNTSNDNITSIDGYICKICNFICANKQTFEIHIITHRDPCMAYQCLECGQCFVVKPSFSTHLLLEHGITNVEEYINKKQCYNETALLKQPHNEETIDEPVKENQCKICKDQFDNHTDLEKHFRVHGMAFLMKNTHKNNSP